jgi:hypothetical protein
MVSFISPSSLVGPFITQELSACGAKYTELLARNTKRYFYAWKMMDYSAMSLGQISGVYIAYFFL